MYQIRYAIFVYFLVHIVDSRKEMQYALWYKGGDAMPISYAKLFERMAQKGIRKVDLRKIYKINPKTVDSLVNNRSVTVDTIIQLCDILDCQPGDIMEYVREPDVSKNG